MRICLVYDSLFPHTVGGAERWYRNLAERLAADGHDVTYLTLRQWDAAPDVSGFEVRAVGPRMSLYTRSGRRRVLPPLVFGAGVLRHLLRSGGSYDAVHTGSFPYFSVLAAALARLGRRFPLVVDWHEVWSREYWREYLGRAGVIGWWVQAACARVRQRAFCFSRLHARRLREIGGPEARVLEGGYSGPLGNPSPERAEPVVVFAGRLIPEKRAAAVAPAVARLPELGCVIYGDGPERAELERQGTEVKGFVPPDEVSAALRTALCLLLPSRREGYGLIVVEAASVGPPRVVVAAPDHAATELVDDGVNGFVAASASADDLASAVLRVHQGGMELR